MHPRVCPTQARVVSDTCIMDSQDTISVEISAEGESRESAAALGKRVVLSALRLPALVLILLVNCLTFLQTLPRDPVLYDRLMRPFRTSSRAVPDGLFARLR